MAARSTSTLVGLLKQGWNEIPEVVSTTAGAIVSIGVGIYLMYQYDKQDKYNKRYKTYFTIMRPEDPRVAKIHKD